MISNDWMIFDSARPPDNALIVFYVPFARYIWGCGRDYEQIKAEYPAVTYWKVATHEPPSK